MILIFLTLSATPYISENRDDLIKEYNMISPLLQGNPVDERESNLGKERHLIPMNLLEDPVIIERFTKNVFHEYYGDDRDCFADAYPIMVMNTPLGRVSFAGDPIWLRVIWGWEESINFYSFGSPGSGDGEFKSMGDIDGKYPNLFITDTWNHRIQHWRVEIDSVYISLQGKWIKFIREIKFVKSFGEGRLSIPEGLDYSDNGTPDEISDDIIYVADMESLIVKFEIDGTFMGNFGEKGRRRNGKGYFGGPSDIAVGKENGANTNDIYVIDFGNNCIVNYPDGVDISSPEFYWNKYYYPETSEFSLYTIDVDYYGYPYVGDSKCRIVKYKKDLSDTLWSYGSYGFGKGHFNHIHDIYIYQDELLATERWTDSSGISYYWIESVKDTTSPVVQILSPPDTTYVNGEIKIIGTVRDDYLKYWQVYIGEGAYPDTFELIEWGTGQKEREVLTEWNSLSYSEITSILLLAQDEGGNISTDTVRVWVGEPKIELSIGRKNKKCCKIGLFKLPLDVAVDDNLNIYVSNTYYRRIQKFNREGSYLYSFRTFFRTYWKRWWSWTKPGGIAAWRDKIFVVNLYNRRIQVFDTTGSYLYEFDNLGPKHRTSDELTFEGDSDICPIDTGDSFLEELSSSYLEEPSCWDKKPNLFIHPFDVALTEEGNVFVSDMSSHRIHEFTIEGDYVSSFGTWGDSVGKFKVPCGIDIMGNQIAVADRENDRVQLFSLSGEAKRIIENDFDRPFDVGFDSDTSLYVVDCNKNRVQKFDRFGNHLLTIYDNSIKLPKGCDVKDALYLSDTHNDRVLKFPGWFSAPQNERLEMFRELLSRNNSLSCIYPNPCSQTAKIYLNTEGKSESINPGVSSLGSTSSHSVQLDIYNISGRKIRKLFEGQINTNQYLFDWDLRDEKGSVVSSGVYFYRLMVDENAESNKIVVVR